METVIGEPRVGDDLTRVDIKTREEIYRMKDEEFRSDLVKKAVDAYYSGAKLPLERVVEELEPRRFWTLEVDNQPSNNHVHNGNGHQPSENFVAPTLFDTNVITATKVN